jgi:histidinol-phosphatase
MSVESEMGASVSQRLQNFAHSLQAVHKTDLLLALELADIADEISQRRFLAQDLTVQTKPDATPVTDADQAIEKALREKLHLALPDDLVVGEEFGKPESVVGRRYWVIDPIDGTKNFMRGVPIWATLIALIDSSGKTVVGVVSAPTLYRRWFAVKDGGAYMSENGKQPERLHVSSVKNLADASMAYSDLLGWGERRNAFLQLHDQVWRTRGIGDFWSHLLVAQGAAEIAAEPSLSLWDMAALEVIVVEAGGRFSDLEGRDGCHGASAVSSNGVLHGEFLEQINTMIPSDLNVSDKHRTV